MAETTTFLECAARLEAMIRPGEKFTITVQQLGEIVQEMAHQQIELMRYLDREFPNAERIRKAVFTRRGSTTTPTAG